MASGLRRIIKNLSALFSADLFSQVVGVALLAFYARQLSKEELAVLPVYEMVMAVLVLVGNFGILPMLVRRLPALLERSPAEARALATTGFRVVTGASLVTAALGALAAGWLGRLLAGDVDPGDLLRLMCLGVPACAVTRVSEHVLWGASRFTTLARVHLVRSLGNAFAVAGLLSHGLPGLILGLVLRDWLAGTCAVWSVRDLLLPRGERGHPARELLRESRPYYVEAYVMYFRADGDNWVVASYLGPAALGTYYVARRVYGFLLGFFTPWDRVITTTVLRRREDVAEVGRHLERLLTILSQTVVPGIFLVAALTPALLPLLAGDQHADAVIPGMILCIAILVHFLRQPLARGVFAVTEPIERLKLSAIESAVLIAALALLTPVAGVVGVASARVLTGLVSTALAGRMVRAVAPFHYPLRAVGASVLAAIAMGAALLWWQTLGRGWYLLPLATLASAAVFVALDLVLNAEAFFGTLREIRPARVRGEGQEGQGRV